MNVYYTPKMLGPPQEHSPSAHKPARVVESWLAIAPRLKLIEPSAVTIEQLCLAHDREFVTGVLAGRLRNGFGNTSREVAASLPHTSGAMLAAARAAIAGRTATIAPCSGFHHARFAAAGGFCTFNGLMVTARVLLTEGVAHRVGILDADMHYGDGTDDILERTGETRVEHCTIGQNCTDPTQAEGFLERLPLMLRRFEGCDVLLYQAGADPHIDDPLGGSRSATASCSSTAHRAGCRSPGTWPAVTRHRCARCWTSTTPPSGPALPPTRTRSNRHAAIEERTPCGAEHQPLPGRADRRVG